MQSINELPIDLYNSLALKVQEIKNGETVLWADVKKELEEMKNVYNNTDEVI